MKRTVVSYYGPASLTLFISFNGIGTFFGIIQQEADINCTALFHNSLPFYTGHIHLENVDKLWKCTVLGCSYKYTKFTNSLFHKTLPKSSFQQFSNLGRVLWNGLKIYRHLTVGCKHTKWCKKFVLVCVLWIDWYNHIKSVS